VLSLVVWIKDRCILLKANNKISRTTTSIHEKPCKLFVNNQCFLSKENYFAEYKGSLVEKPWET